jgi:hypothetical protein
MRYYLLPISDREPLEWILSASRTAFPSYRRREADALGVGDKLLLYTTRGCFRNPTRDRGRVIGVATVESKARELERPVEFGGREFPLLVELSFDMLAPRERGVELAPLISRLGRSFPKPEAGPQRCGGLSCPWTRRMPKSS